MDVSEKPCTLPWIAFVNKDAYEISKLFMREYRVAFISIIAVEEEQFLRGTTRICFDPDLDTLFVNYCGITEDEEPYADEDQLEHQAYLQNLHNGPHALSMMPKVNIMLDMQALVGLVPGSLWVKYLMARPYSDCVAQHGHCTIKLANTVFSTTSTEIRSSGLFGMFGEERNVLIDIKDTAKIDRYESYIDQLESAGGNCSDGWNYFPKNKSANRLWAIGAGLYGSEYGALAESDGARSEDGEDARALSTVHSSRAEEDGATALHLIKQSWLEANHCFEPAEDPLLAWTGDEKFRKWDDEHHVAKHWLSKLPTFSFVVMYTATERKGMLCNSA